MTSTIETISNSSDILWALVCRAEDAAGNRTEVEAEAIALLSDDDRMIFSEELRRIERKEWRDSDLYVIKCQRPCLTYR